MYFPVRMPYEVCTLPLSRVRELLFLKMSVVFSTRVRTLLEIGLARMKLCSHLTFVAPWLPWLSYHVEISIHLMYSYDSPDLTIYAIVKYIIASTIILAKN